MPSISRANSDNTTPATTAQSKGVFHTGYNNDMISVAPEASLIGGSKR